MRARIKSTLNHPLFGPGDTNNGACTLVADGIIELEIPRQLLFRRYTYLANTVLTS